MMKNIDVETKERIYKKFQEFLQEELDFYEDLSDDLPIKKKIQMTLKSHIESFNKFASDVKIDVVLAFYRETLNMLIKFEIDENGEVEVQRYLLGE